MVGIRRVFAGIIIFVLALSVYSSPARATRFEVGLATSGSLVGMDRDSLGQRLDDIKDMGVTWLRVDFSWPTIQPDNADHYDWSGYDYLVEQASERQLKILAVLAYTPKWAQSPACQESTQAKAAARKCSPRNTHDFARFAGAVAERYSHQRIRGYEIWNEPNLLSYWRTMQPNQTLAVDPAAYARHANAAAVEIRKYNSDCVILPGGLAPLFESGPARGMNQADYIAQLLPHLRKDLFTGIAIHPYSWPALPDTPAPYNAFYTVDAGDAQYNLREIMNRKGWGDKEIWGTEFGASTRGERSGEVTGALRPDHVTELRQAEIIKIGLNSWYKKENVGPLFVHSDSDAWLPSHKNEGGFGLRRDDGSKKPAYQAFKEVTDTINKADMSNEP